MLSNGSKHVRNVIQWHYNSFFSKKLQKIAQKKISKKLQKFPKNYEKRITDPPFVIRLSYTGFLKTSPKLRICTFQLY